jgi:hypothetical protein
MTGASLGLVFAWLALSGASGETTQPVTQRPGCFDVVLVADVLKETPTPFTQSMVDSIVVEWPWFLDVHVRKVLIGREHRRSLRVSALLHAGYNTGGKPARMYLRRDSDGAYQLLHVHRENLPTKCGPADASSEPFIRAEP